MLLLNPIFWAYLVWAGCAVLAVWSGYRALRNRPVILKQLVAGGVVELFLVLQAVLSVVEVAQGRELVEPALYWGYVVVAVLLLPAGAVVAIAERSRWSSVVLLVLALALAAMQARMLELWWMGVGA